MSNQRDVVIVGGGPAGACAGLALQAAGHRVTLIERRREVQASLCGEGVPLVALAMLEGVTGFDSSPFIQYLPRDGRLVFPDRRSCILIRDMAVLDRTAWQRAMIDRIEVSGGTVQLGVRVKRIEQTSSEVVLSGGRTVGFDVCVDASGPKSRLRRSRDRLVCSQITVSGYSPPSESLWFVIDKRLSPHGSWMFPRKDGYHLGLVGGYRRLKKLRSTLELDHHPGRFAAAPIPVNGDRFVVGNVVVLGDSSGMAAAVHGGGLFPIIASLDPLRTAVSSGSLAQLQDAIEHIVDGPAQRSAVEALHTLTNPELDRLANVLDGQDLSTPSQVPHEVYVRLSALGSIADRFMLFLRGFAGPAWSTTLGAGVPD